MPNNLFRDIPTLMELNPRHNIDFFESSNTTGITSTFGNTGQSSQGKWWGGVLASNGKIYGMPLNSTTVLEIDPITRTTSTFPSSSRGCAGGVLAPNGKIYGIPASSSFQVLEINPITRTTSSFGSGGTYIGGVLAPNGKIYGIPNDARKQVLEIDPITRTTSTFGTITSTYSGVEGGVLAPNGKIYGIPSGNNGLMLEIDPVARTTSLFSGGSSGTYYAGGVLAQNGKIYCVPYDGAFVSNIPILVIDPITRTTSTFGSIPIAPSPPYDPPRNRGGVLAPNGKIYCMPYNVVYSTILEIDPLNNSFLSITNPGGSYAGGVLAPNGKIYGIPYTAVTILEISTGCAHKPALSLLGPYNNKF